MTTNHLILLILCYLWVNFGFGINQLRQNPLWRPTFSKIVLITLFHLPGELISLIIRKKFATCIIRLAAFLCAYFYFLIIYTILNIWIDNAVILLIATLLIVFKTTPLMFILMSVPAMFIGGLLHILHIPDR